MLTDELIDLTDANPLTFVPSEPAETPPGAYEVVEHLAVGLWIASDLAPGVHPTASRAYEALLDELAELPTIDGLVLGIRDMRTGEVITI